VLSTVASSVSSQLGLQVWAYGDGSRSVKSCTSNGDCAFLKIHIFPQKPQRLADEYSSREKKQEEYANRCGIDTARREPLTRARCAEKDPYFVPGIDVRNERSWDTRADYGHRQRVEHPARRPILEKVLQQVVFHPPGDRGAARTIQESQDLSGGYRFERNVSHSLRKRTEIQRRFLESHAERPFSLDVGFDGFEEFHQSPLKRKAATCRNNRVSCLA
jgi:hypothetical protein